MSPGMRRLHGSGSKEAINEKRINLDANAINPNYHAVNMVIMRTHSPQSRGREDEGSWVPLPEVEHKLTTLVLSTTSVAATRVPHANEDLTWTTVQGRPCLTMTLPWCPHPTTPSYATPTRRQPNPSRQHPPPRFIPKSEGDTPFPRRSHVLPTLE